MSGQRSRGLNVGGAGNTMSLQITAEQREVYRHTARARMERERQLRRRRRQEAWKLAHQAAALLRAQFGVSRVVAFGSLSHPGRFTQWSDVDLAAWGLTSSNWLKAMAAVRDLSLEIELNLVDVAACSPDLLIAIERDGVPL